MNSESLNFPVTNDKPYKLSALSRFLLVILVVLFFILGVESFLYFKMRSAEKKLLEEQISSFKPKPLSEEEAFLEKEASIEAGDKRRELARKVLGEDYSKYDERSLAREFGVSKIGGSGLKVTCKVSQVEEESLLVDCGSFSHLAEITRDDIPVFLVDSRVNCVDRSNACERVEKVNVSDIRVGDLVALVYNRTNSQELRSLRLIYKYY